MAKLSDLTDAQLETQLKKYINLFKNAQNADEKTKYKQFAMRLKEERQKRMDLQNDIEPAAPPPPPKPPAAPRSAKPAKAAKPKAPPPAQKVKEKPGKTPRKPQTQQGTPRLWNPNAAANWSILFTPVFGAWLQKMNWEELNKTEKAEKSKKWAYVGGGLLILALILPNALATLLSITFLLAWYFVSAKKQVKYVNDQNIDYEKREWKKPIIYGAGGVVGYLLVAVVLSVVFSLVGSFSGFGNSDVSIVKNSTMNGYPNTTVGKAFEASFDNTTWEAFESKKGERVVQFTGKISRDLHNTVVNNLRGQMQGLPDYQVVKVKLSLLQSAIETLGGIENRFFKDLNRKYDCKLEHMNLAGGVFAFLPECQDEETMTKYMDEAIEKYLDVLWEPGEPVEVQWIVSPDGESFNITHMGSASWEGVELKTILNMIYS